jgi:AcrR family transcriptional regulator
MATLTQAHFPASHSSTRFSGLTAPVTRIDEPPRRARAKRGEGDRLRLEILDAVDQLLTKAPAREDAVSIRAVADLVGCTPPAIYLHFFDKNELLFEVCARRFLQLNERVARATAGVTDPLAALEAGAREYVRFGIEHPEHYRVLFMSRSVLTTEQLEEMRAKGITGLTDLVKRCKACITAGSVSCSDAKLMACGVWTIAHGIVSLMIAKPHVDWPKVDALCDHVLGTYLQGLRAQQPARVAV